MSALIPKEKVRRPLLVENWGFYFLDPHGGLGKT